ncbi:hypothetical protein HYH03_016175 [Edaphochlamys debaryana]|uniref:Uncharacterized protein n=1 Tax=Edaphochlamys debaryana TaxID=47281 RepID=A0A835XLN4_9CHLO|nr:hypothetical protein HYH03_016175 [Edaphochlamys debaryana]|eukprot:KAG2485078.1 hypothetical protein HYH03_016175 [Edaphochlamys debaryana]
MAELLSSVTVAYTLMNASHEHFAVQLLQPFEASPDTRSRVSVLVVEEVQKPKHSTFPLPAAPLAALLRLLPSLHTVRLPPGSFSNIAPCPDPNGAVLSALASLPHLRDLTLPNLGVAVGVGALGALGLTRLVMHNASWSRFYNPHIIEPPALGALGSLQSLRHLELHANHTDDVTPADVTNLMTSLPSLERLAVSGLTAGDVLVGDRYLQGTTLELGLDAGFVTSISLVPTNPEFVYAASVGALAVLAAALLPATRPAPAPRIPALRLSCAVTPGSVEADAETLLPLRDLSERCEGEQVAVISCAVGRRVSAQEAEDLVRLLGKPERLRFWDVVGEQLWVRLRGRDEPPILDIGGDAWDADAQPYAGADGQEQSDWDRALVLREGASAALAAIWADPGGGSELRRLRRMLALDVRGGGEEWDEEEEEDEGNW